MTAYSFLRSTSQTQAAWKAFLQNWKNLPIKQSSKISQTLSNIPCSFSLTTSLSILAATISAVSSWSWYCLCFSTAEREEENKTTIHTELVTNTSYTAYAWNHTAVRKRWKIPVPFTLQGLHITWISGTLMPEPDLPNTKHLVLTDCIQSAALRKWT